MTNGGGMHEGGAPKPADAGSAKPQETKEAAQASTKSPK